MCETCGCSGPSQHHHPTHEHGEVRKVEVRQNVLSENDRHAERNRGYFAAKKMLVLNLVSSPGAGKTALLERTLAELKTKARMAVIVGDLATDNDAQRLRRSTKRVVQINTGTACHLDAHAVAHAVEDLGPAPVDILFIENVGNLVCPAAFDLGEDLRVVLSSVTEGEDKPLKYPVIFEGAHLVVVNKTDLSDAAGYARDAALKNIARAAPRAHVLELSARTGDGLQRWYDWLLHELAHKQGTPH